MHTERPKQAGIYQLHEGYPGYPGQGVPKNPEADIRVPVGFPWGGKKRCGRDGGQDLVLPEFERPLRRSFKARFSDEARSVAGQMAKCDGTGTCVEVCEYEDAIAVETITFDGREIRRAVVTPANCSGCGNCVSACPNRAVDVQGWTLAQYDAMIDAITLDVSQFAEVVA